ncbi:hypothetical protein OG394_09035 [Kribbella sp. NBC_01245]|uniref:hypothetical protein n=1 Tax=Kribbella sp. NBC_01245 TaxID=2903578 RepID=UPI002E289373|nr:hypothetical protein [Kribbella sp. NBC_01245]
MDQARALLARAREQHAARLATAESAAPQVAVVPGGAAVPRRVVPAPRTTETRVQQALDTAAQDRTLPTLPGVSELLPGGSLRGGATYSVRGSTSLVMAMMAGPSAEGAWCGVVGLPTFGAEAARGLGVDLDRLVLVPDPEQDWLSVVAALVDALTVVVVRPPGVVTPGEASRLAARLRSRGAVLISVGAWPGSEARFEVQGTRWTGLQPGHGRLLARQATIAVTGRGSAGRPNRHLLWLPAEDGSIRSVDPVPVSGLAPIVAPVWQQEAVG